MKTETRADGGVAEWSLTLLPESPPCGKHLAFAICQRIPGETWSASMLRMDDDHEDLEDLVDKASDSMGPVGPFGVGAPPVAGIIVVGLILLIVIYILQHPHSFLARHLPF